MTTSLQSSVTLDPKPLLSWSPDTRTRLVLRLLQSLQFGELKIILPDASQRVFVGLQRDARRHIGAEITIHDSRVFNLALSRGDIGFGEAYMQGYWSSPDPAALLKLLLLNRHAIDKMIYGRWWSVLWDQVRHLLRSNRRAQAKKNIAAHYDLGNDFYQVWLDPSMSYSSALFDGTGNRGNWAPTARARSQHP
jgi:cyclopropane-fatty-acyl-phospholipid synthase